MQLLACSPNLRKSMGEIEEIYGGVIEREGMQFYGESKRRETHFGVNRRENRILMFSIRYHRLISIPFKTKETPLFYEFVVFITRAFFKQFKFLSSC